jgi:NAD(P)-dependent dehydrogenase (short-subunit alcohol dehydrogenase family)
MAALGGRNALVTGAGSGIGRAIAAALVERGAHVTLADIDGEAVAQLAGTLGPLALPSNSM